MSPRAEALPAWAGEGVDIERFWAQAWREFRKAQRKLARRAQPGRSSWRVDQQAGLIVFERADGAVLTSPIQIVGSWSPTAERLLWGWTHPCVAPRLRRDAERTRWFGQRHGVSELCTPSLNMTEADAWRIAAVAQKVNAAEAVFGAPSDGPLVLMTLGPLKPA